jgi:hypothetical protein
MDPIHTPSMDRLTHLNKRVAAHSAEISRLRAALKTTPRWRYLRRDFLRRQLNETMIRWFELVDDQETAYRAFERELGGRVNGPRAVRTLRQG